MELYIRREIEIGCLSVFLVISLQDVFLHIFAWFISINSPPESVYVSVCRKLIQNLHTNYLKSLKIDINWNSKYTKILQKIYKIRKTENRYISKNRFSFFVCLFESLHQSLSGRSRKYILQLHDKSTTNTIRVLKNKG